MNADIDRYRKEGPAREILMDTLGFDNTQNRIVKSRAHSESQHGILTTSPRTRLRTSDAANNSLRHVYMVGGPPYLVRLEIAT